MAREAIEALIIALAPNSWHGPWMNRQQLLSRLAKRHHVIYSTGPLSVWDRHGKDWRGARFLPATSSADGVLLDEPGRFLPRWPTFQLYDALSIRLASARWNRMIRRHSGQPTIAYVFHPEFYPYLANLEFDKLVYHAYDQFSRTPRWNDRLAVFESALLGDADIVFASSKVTAAYLQKIGEREVRFLPNGVDFDAFSNVTAAIPTDLARIAAPRAGYVGRINRKVDIELSTALAKLNPRINFVFIGPVVDLDRETEESIRLARNQPNIHFLGEKKLQELPAYMQHLDVGLMCYKCNDDNWTGSLYPLKMHEYLAGGLPVVSSNVEAVHEFSKVVWIANDIDEWSRMISDAIAGLGPADREARRQVAANNTWDQRVQLIEDAILRD